MTAFRKIKKLIAGEALDPLDPRTRQAIAITPLFALIGLMILLWMFFLGLYTISIFTKRPIKPYATAIVGAGLMIVVFIGSTAEWFAMPVPPPK